MMKKLRIFYPIVEYPRPITDYPIIQLGEHYKSMLVPQTLGDGKSWMLMGPLSVDVPDYGRITVPAGFVYDFASIPFWARALYQPATGKHRAAACIHDWLYYSGMYTRKESDEIFSILMRLDGVMGIDNTIIYSAVRAGGWYIWNKRHG